MFLGMAKKERSVYRYYITLRAKKGAAVKAATLAKVPLKIKTMT